MPLTIRKADEVDYLLRSPPDRYREIRHRVVEDDASARQVILAALDHYLGRTS